MRVVLRFSSVLELKWSRPPLMGEGGGSVREGGGASGLVVDADDLPGPLLPPAVEELRLPLLLYGHGRPVQHWGNTTAKIALAVSAWCSENCS